MCVYERRVCARALLINIEAQKIYCDKLISRIDQQPNKLPKVTAQFPQPTTRARRDHAGDFPVYSNSVRGCGGAGVALIGYTRVASRFCANISERRCRCAYITCGVVVCACRFNLASKCNDVNQTHTRPPVGRSVAIIRSLKHARLRCLITRRAVCALRSRRLYSTHRTGPPVTLNKYAHTAHAVSPNIHRQPPEKSPPTPPPTCRA